MSESPDDPAMPQLAPPDPMPQRAVESPVERARARTSPIAWIALALAVIEGGALAFAWTHPPAPAGLTDQLASISDDAHDANTKAAKAASGVDGMQVRFASMQQAVAALQSRPERKPFDPQPLQSAIASQRSDLNGMQGSIKDASSAAADAQKAAKGARQEAEGAEKAAEGARQEAEKAQEAADGAQKAASDGRDAAAASVAALSGTLSGKIDQVSSRLDALSTRLDQEGAQGRQVASLASSAERLARLQAASVALSIGRPIGEVPNAPPALARFADRAPPTEASLILAFPDAAVAALRASQPDTAGEGFFKRIWIRAQSAVTVRDGTHVLLGDPAAGIIAAARERLAAGDLDGAVSVLGALSGPAADAMDPWRSQAAALVDARAALASMMARR